MNDICCPAEIACGCPTCVVRRNAKLEGPGVKSGLSLRAPLGDPQGKSMTHRGYESFNDSCSPACSGENE